MLIYSEGLMARSSSECVGSGDPTSQVYASTTMIKLVIENYKLLPYASLQLHNVLTKNREYQLGTPTP
jgi:hypothetical protein